MRRRFSAPLLPGMTVGLVAPASPVFEPARRSAAVRLLEEMGFRVLRGSSVDAIENGFAAPDSLRAADLTAMFLNDAVDAIVCLRGGYGSTRLLSLLDYGQLARHPKPFIGFSDITALHTALAQRCGFLTVHGPMPGACSPVGLRDSAARAQWLAVVAGAAPRQVANPDGTPFFGHGHRTAEGRLTGGNLSVLCGLIGTPWETAWDGALLLVEDVAERLDQLDAMMARLEAHGVFRRIAGLVVGDFSRYDGMTSARPPALSGLVAKHVPDSLPILYGLHAGHGRDRMTVVLNARYRLHPQRATLTLLEAPFRR